MPAPLDTKSMLAPTPAADGGAAFTTLSKALVAASAASLLHAMWRLTKKVLEVRRMRRVLKDVPMANYDTGGSALGWLKAIKPNRRRVHDWFDEVTAGFKVCKLSGLAWDPNTMLVVVRDPSCVKHMLKDNFRAYDKPDSAVIIWYYIEKWLGRGIFLLQHGDGAKDGGDEWYLQRKVSLGIFTRGNFQSNFQKVFTEKSHALCASLEDAADCGKAVDMQETFFDFTMDAAMKVLFGEEKHSMGGGGGASSFARAFDEAHHSVLLYCLPWMTTLALTELLPWPLGGAGGVAWKVMQLCNPNYWKFRLANYRCHRDAERFVARARTDPKKSEREDLLALFIKAEESERIYSSDARLKDVFMSFVFAGRDTTACTLSWMFYELALHPEIQAKLVEEVDRVLPGGTVPSFKAVAASSMPYLNGLLYEVLRLHPAVPSDQKIATADDVMPDGSRVPKGARVLFLPRAMGRDPSLYRDPLKVMPERWIPFSAPSPFDFPVFQGGPRICLGMDMAIFEIKVVAAMLMQKYSFSISAEEAAKISYRTGLVMAISNSEKQDSNCLWLTPKRRSEGTQ
mmetsp:Transcript_49075/g.116797  ORF Transcript_49075/g.116797 Transcript_49075/m.116797 type:complete len:569 (-) Transcript_49075:156-1862(-)